MMQLTFLSSIGLATFLALFFAQFPRFLPRPAAGLRMNPSPLRRPAAGCSGAS